MIRYEPREHIIDAELASGNLDAWKQALGFSRPIECPTCAAHKPGEMMPPHNASSRCESGWRNHCTCDICF